jgi:WXXGXW repeat (2 copies)
MRITRLVRYAVFAAILALSASAFAGVFVQVAFGPPVLPVYAQPPCPGDGYIWTPGYWAYGPDGYYWVPGTWVVAPEPGFLWTPGYWGWNEGFYVWHAGYWGPHVGFYGGINYGFGYTGSGFYGGYWDRGHYFYNRSVTNINITNVHVYNKTVINETTVNRVSFNGGRGGIEARPTRDEQRFSNERHFEATHAQVEHENGARGNREFLASVNHGRPAIAATARPAEFHGRDAVPARGAGDNRGMERGVPRPQNNARGFDRNQERGADRGNASRGEMGRQNGSGNAGRQNMDRQSMGRQNSDRSMPRDDRNMNARNAPRPDNRAENRGGPAPRQEGRNADNGRGHENAPRQEHEDRGRK